MIDFRQIWPFFTADMSDQHNDSKHPVLSIIGKIFIFAIPAALIVMLGVVGFAFLKGSGVKEAPEKAKTEMAAAPAPAESAAPATGASDPASQDTPAPTEAAAPAATPASGGGEIDPAQMQLGQAAFATCAACHGPDGTGLKAGPMLMAPSMVGSESLLGDPDVPLLIVLKGIAKEDMKFMGMMMPLGAALSDEQLAGVLTFTRNSWGNSARAVTVEEAAAARAKYADINAPAGIKRAEIQATVDAHK
tara:strand:+ start:440 stop:1183 length:744 start_codon:yes stop_codon:yes gene_type:complete